MSKVVPDIRFKNYIEIWEVIMLKDASSNIGTGRSSFAYNELSKENPFAILGSTSIIGYDNDYDHAGDFILTARVGANAGNLYRYSGKVKISDNTVFIQGENLSFLYPLLTYFNLKKLSFGTGQPLIKASELKNLKLKLPSFNEQKKVGEFFKGIDEIIKLQQQLLNEHKQLKKAMLQKMFPQKGETVPRVRFAKFTDNWEQKEMGELTEIKTGKKDVQDATVNGAYPFYIRSDEIKKIDSYSFDGEAILIPGEGRLGEIFHYINGKFDFHQRVYKISDFTDVSALFLLYFMKLKFKRHAMKYTVKATVDSLRLPIIKEFKVIVPNIVEQEKIGNFFKQLDETITLHQKKLETYQELKKAMLQKMFV